MKKKYNEILRRQVLEIMGNRCARCGFSDPRALQIDHLKIVGQREREHSYSKFTESRIRKMNEKGEPWHLEYQLLCANCNWIKRFENNEVRNGDRHDT